MTLSRRTLLKQAALAAPVTLAPVLAPRAAAAATEAVTAPASGQGAIQRLRVGEIEVIALLDGYAPIPLALLNGYEAEAGAEAARLAYKREEDGQMTIGVNGYLIRSGGRVIAVDTGAPKAMAPTVGAWHHSLAQAGVAPGEVDTVVMTHLHVDHIGGLSRLSEGAAVALLPQARFICADAEWAFLHDESVLNATPAAFQPWIIASRASVAPYAGRREEVAITRETEIAPGVWTVPLPGHTPGHLGLRVQSGDAALLIWGDVVHATSYQFSNPGWSMAFDADPAQAEETRRAMFDMAASDRLQVAGMHLDFPAVGYVERQADAYRYVAAPVRVGL